MIENGWRWCSTCSGLFLLPEAASRCPAGDRHTAATSGVYHVVRDDPAATGQAGWRHCVRCAGLVFGADGICVGGVRHETAASGSYTLPHRGGGDPAARGQPGWRWCSKCQHLYFKDSASRCPVGGSHGDAPSGFYTVGDGHGVTLFDPVAGLLDVLLIDYAQSVMLTRSSNRYASLVGERPNVTLVWTAEPGAVFHLEVQIQLDDSPGRSPAALAYEFGPRTQPRFKTGLLSPVDRRVALTVTVPPSDHPQVRFMLCAGPGETMTWEFVSAIIKPVLRLTAPTGWSPEGRRAPAPSR